MLHSHRISTTPGTPGAWMALIVLMGASSALAGGGSTSLPSAALPEAVSEAAGESRGASLAKLAMVPAYAAWLDSAADRKACSAALATIGAGQTIGQDGLLAPLACAPSRGSSSPDPCVAQLEEAFRAGGHGQTAKGEALWSEVRSSSHCTATLDRLGDLAVDRYGPGLNRSTTKERFRDQSRSASVFARFEQIDAARAELDGQEKAQRALQTARADAWAAAQQKPGHVPIPEPGDSGRSGFQSFMDTMTVLLSVGVQLQDLKGGRGATPGAAGVVVPRAPAEYSGPSSKGSPASVGCRPHVIGGRTYQCNQ